MINSNSKIKVTVCLLASAVVLLSCGKKDDDGPAPIPFVHFDAPSIITNNAKGPQGMAKDDLDGDGDIDLLVCSSSDDKVRWFKNDGKGNFTEHFVTENVTDPFDVAPVDMDNDGDMDVLVSNTFNAMVRWYENDGNENFTLHTIFASNGSARLAAVDLDGDSDPDVLSTDSGNTIRWHENDGQGNFTTHEVFTEAKSYDDVFGADFDKDGDTDIVACSYFDSKIRWYKNDGNQTFTPQTIYAGGNPMDLFVTDMNGDGYEDVVAALQGTLRWFRNDGKGNFFFEEIAKEKVFVYDTYAIDMDKDGDVDVLSAILDEDKIRWYENDGNLNFTAHDVFTGADAANVVFGADADGDGDVDVFSSGLWDHTIRLHRNKLTP